MPAGADEPKPAGAAPAAASQPAAPDVFGDVVRAAGLSREELGFRGKGTWARWPRPPYRLPFFDDLLADATSTYEFAHTMGNAVEDLLTPENLRSAPEKEKPETSFVLATILGTDRRIGGFRGFGIGLLGEWTPPAGEDPLAFVLRVHGVEDPKAYEAVPEALRAPLARLVDRLVSAREKIESGLRRVTPAQRMEVFEALPGLLSSTPDATHYVPVVDDVAGEVDEPSLAYGCLRALAATQVARRELEEAWEAGKRPAARARFLLPGGDVVLACGEAPAAGSAETEGVLPALLRVTMGDAVPLRARVGVTSPEQPLSVDLEIHPRDGKAQRWVRTAKGTGAFGCGVCGCGITWSAGAADEEREAEDWAMGAGLFGMGVLIDEGGNDVYRARSAAQGCGCFGVGMLLDASGNDRYELSAGDGQGLGAPNGIGVLADRSGDDVYFAERSPEKAGKDRADYHSQGKVVASNAQGCGMGRRGDLSDGHDWAGGLGVLIDVDGNDTYDAGNFSQGLGYWFGTGVLWDGGGNDTYRSVYFTQGSGAHFAVGALIDEGGDDEHLLEETGGAGLGFGWDAVNALLLDRAGNDRYEAKVISMGMAMVRSHAWFVDEGGDDVYVLNAGEKGFGEVDRLDTYVQPGRTSTFPFHLPQTGFFLDLGGADRYLRRPAGEGKPVFDERAADGKSWDFTGPRPEGAGPNVARGVDVPSGRLGFLSAFPRRR